MTSKEFNIVHCEQPREGLDYDVVQNMRCVVGVNDCQDFIKTGELEREHFWRSISIVNDFAPSGELRWDRRVSPWVVAGLRHPLAGKQLRVFSLTTGYIQENGPAKGNVGLQCPFPWSLVNSGTFHFYRIEFMGKCNPIEMLRSRHCLECLEAMIVRYALTTENFDRNLPRCDLTSSREELLRLDGHRVLALNLARTLRDNRLVPLVHGKFSLLASFLALSTFSCRGPLRL